MSYKNHLSIGFNEVAHKDLSLVTPNENFKSFVINLEENYEFEEVFVTHSVERRPDLIADAFYGTTTLWWLILLSNNISDPFEELKVGTRIRIPIL